ncbi:MAG: hypothetical protein HC805_05830, partial [Alkalinema sp. RL_2_19]|nr:hypothetical protein [Alkalinema sp. RL_2_19]
MAIPVQREKIAMIVGEGNPYSGSMVINQFADIFRGVITNWSEVGGEDIPVRFVDQPEESDTRIALSRYPAFKAYPFENGPTTERAQDEKADSLANALGTDGISYVVVSQARDLPGTRIVVMHQTLPDDPRYPFSQSSAYVYRRGQLTPAAKAFLGNLNQPAAVDALKAAAPAGAIVLLPDEAAVAAAIADDPNTAAGVTPTTSATPVPDAASSATTAAAGTDTKGIYSRHPQPDLQPLWLLLPLGAGVAWWALKSRKDTGGGALSGGSMDASMAVGSGAATLGTTAVGGAMASGDRDPMSGDLTAASATDTVSAENPTAYEPPDANLPHESLDADGVAIAAADPGETQRPGLGGLAVGAAGLAAAGAAGAAKLGGHDDPDTSNVDEVSADNATENHLTTGDAANNPVTNVAGQLDLPGLGGLAAGAAGIAAAGAAAGAAMRGRKADGSYGETVPGQLDMPGLGDLDADGDRMDTDRTGTDRSEDIAANARVNANPVDDTAVASGAVVVADPTDPNFQPITQLPAEMQPPAPTEESDIPFGQGRDAARGNRADLDTGSNPDAAQADAAQAEPSGANVAGTVIAGMGAVGLGQRRCVMPRIKRLPIKRSVC